jgi:hypothetical protein
VANPMPRAAPVIAMVLPVILSMRSNFTGVKFWVEEACRIDQTGIPLDVEGSSNRTI